MKNIEHKPKKISNPKRKQWVQKTFEVSLTAETKLNLNYYIQQELSYYNSLVENMTPWLRTFPQELVNFKGNEKRLWNTMAEYGLNVSSLISTKLEDWPEVLSAQKQSIYDILLDENRKPRISARQVELLRIAGAKAELPSLVRNLLANEMMKHMQSQAEILESALKTEIMRSPVQMLQIHTLNSKRHLQVPSSLISNINYDSATKASSFVTPYSKNKIVVSDVDLTTMPFKLMIIRAPHKSQLNGKWYIDLKDTGNYIIGLTDYDYRSRRK